MDKSLEAEATLYILSFLSYLFLVVTVVVVCVTNLNVLLLVFELCAPGPIMAVPSLQVEPAVPCGKSR